LRARLGPRFGLEAAFLIGVAVLLGLLEVSWPAIVAAMAIAWLLVAALEVALARVARPRVARAPQTMSVAAEGALAGGSAVEIEDLGPPPPPPVLEAVPPLVEPAPAAPVVAPQPAAPPVPAPTPIRPKGGREWNLWELERLARDRAGTNPDRDEERTYLLMSLRDFARPDGQLPPDFDALVREAFEDVLQPAS
jgi:hypothetical protein